MDNSEIKNQYNTDLCIIGAGPAGSLLALLALKQNLKVVLVDIAKNFNREFRGEAITPGGVKLLKLAGIFEKIPKDGYHIIKGMKVFENNELIFESNLESLPNIDLGIDIPHPTLLNTIIKECEEYKNFTFIRGYKANDLLKNKKGQIFGIKLSNDKSTEIYSKLVVVANGRYSDMIDKGNFKQTKITFHRDVVWFKLPRTDKYKDGWFTNIRIIGKTHLIILSTFPDSLRVGMYLPKGGFEQLKEQGIEQFYNEIERLEPDFKEIVRENIKSFNDMVLLDIFSSKVEKWSIDGLVLIGDSAHTCSPVLGQGVNLAMRDSYELAKELNDILYQDKKEVVLSKDLDKFENDRKKNINFIQELQTEHENLLALSDDQGSKLRIAKYKELNTSEYKTQMLEKIAYGALTPVL